MEKTKRRVRTLGQHFTTVNPFKHLAFKKWFESIPSEQKKTILEPFAGNGHLPRHIYEAGYDCKWFCTDVDKNVCGLNSGLLENCIVSGDEHTCARTDSEVGSSRAFNGVEVVHADVLKLNGRYFPKGMSVCITNPPYLAKNVASRKGLKYQGFKDDLDVYQSALKLCLKNCEYVCAILPQSFLGQERFWERIQSVVLFDSGMFDSTKHPVCMVLFGAPSKSSRSLSESVFDNKTKDAEFSSRFSVLHHHVGEHVDLYYGSSFLGKIGDLMEKFKRFFPSEETLKRYADKIEFNAPNGSIGFRNTDDTKGPSIGALQKSKLKIDVKKTNRNLTYVDVKTDMPIGVLIKKTNEHIRLYREQTQDIFLTAFKGMRTDGKWRRRLDYVTARALIMKVLIDNNAL